MEVAAEAYFNKYGRMPEEWDDKSLVSFIEQPIARAEGWEAVGRGELTEDQYKELYGRDYSAVYKPKAFPSRLHRASALALGQSRACIPRRRFQNDRPPDRATVPLAARRCKDHGLP